MYCYHYYYYYHHYYQYYYYFNHYYDHYYYYYSSYNASLPYVETKPYFCIAEARRRRRRCEAGRGGATLAIVRVLLAYPIFTKSPILALL